MKGNWALEECNGLMLQSFFLNADNDLVEFPERAKDTSMSLYTNFEIQGGMIQFCTGSSDDDACYQKIK